MCFSTIWYELHAREWPFKNQPAEVIIWQVGSGMKPNLTQIGMGKEISVSISIYLTNADKQNTRGSVNTTNFTQTDLSEQIVRVTWTTFMESQKRLFNLRGNAHDITIGRSVCSYSQWVAKRLSGCIRFLKTNTTHIKWGRALRLTVQLDLTRNRRYIFTDCYRKRSKWIAAIHRNNWTPVSEWRICSYHFVSICWI